MSSAPAMKTIQNSKFQLCILARAALVFDFAFLILNSPAAR